MQPLPQDIHINANGVSLHGSLQLSSGSPGIVLFVQGIGSGRFSPRNKYISEQLNTAGLSTLLIDLLSPGERTVIRNRDQQTRLDWLYARLVRVAEWIRSQEETARLALALFGSNMGATAALKLAAEQPSQVTAVISWSGRPDLIQEQLPDITADTLLIAGSLDENIVEANRHAAEHFRSQIYLEIIEDTGHELKEPGKIETLAQLCRDWFIQHISGVKP